MIQPIKYLRNVIKVCDKRISSLMFIYHRELIIHSDKCLLQNAHLTIKQWNRTCISSSVDILQTFGRVHILNNCHHTFFIYLF